MIEQHPCANPGCGTCDGRGVVTKRLPRDPLPGAFKTLGTIIRRDWCPECIDVDVPDYDELGVGD